jgi:hypothetical protein
MQFAPEGGDECALGDANKKRLIHPEYRHHGKIGIVNILKCNRQIKQLLRLRCRSPSHARPANRCESQNAHNRTSAPSNFAKRRVRYGFHSRSPHEKSSVRCSDLSNFRPVLIQRQSILFLPLPSLAAPRLPPLLLIIRPRLLRPLHIHALNRQRLPAHLIHRHHHPPNPRMRYHRLAGGFNRRVRHAASKLCNATYPVSPGSLRPHDRRAIARYTMPPIANGIATISSNHGIR